MSKPTKTAARQWRSLDDLAQTPSFEKALHREFTEGADEIAVDGVNRRTFLGLVSGTAALAGLEGCVRKPAQFILPYAERPEDTIPGKPRYFASVVQVGGLVQGVLVESQDGRPTKIEGNPRHPASRGKTSAQAQSLALGLYDADRSRGAMVDGVPVAPADALQRLAGKAGSGAAVLLPGTPSPTLNALLQRLVDGGARLYVDGPDAQPNRRAGYALLNAPRVAPVYEIGNAERIVALDADFLTQGPDHLVHAAGFARGRAPERRDEMNRLYAVEPHFTATGMAADNRFQLAASQIGEFAKALAGRVLAGGTVPDWAQAVQTKLTGASSAPNFERWVNAVAADLLAHRGRSVVVVGERQPAWVHAIGVVINDALGAFGRTVRYVDDPTPAAGTLADLAAAIGAGQVQTLVTLGGNPVYSAPGDIDFAAKIGAVATSIHLGFHYDETGRASKIHIPEAHALEAWGDLVAADGTYAIAQPLIEPLYPSFSAMEVVQALLGDAPNGRDAVRAHWQQRSNAFDFEASWTQWLHDGVVEATTPFANPVFTVSALDAQLVAPAAGGEFEVVFALDTRVYDGRYANNAWLQELPDSVTKLTWDNAALINPVTARNLGIAFRHADDNVDVPSTYYGALRTEMLTVRVNGREMTLPALVTPGVEANTIVLPVGYGREFGTVATGLGFASHRLQNHGAWIATGAAVSKASGDYTLATTQDHGSMEGRPVLRSGTVDQLRESPDFVQETNLMPAERLRSLWTEPNVRTGQQWGMSIDLSTCVSCNACTIACQAENNIAVVGKERVLEGREMHWIRLDRYFAGDPSNPTASTQPVGCMHCENAPCEQVCPVAATVHGPEGTNDIAYNRCIGTRYCANNCPYKVRRFNFFNFSQENDARNPLYTMQKNPDVTVRFRGVMEKCTFCIQRVNEAKIRAKVTTPDGVVADGNIVVACEQACPTGAIVFGDVNNPESRVSKLKQNTRNYEVLEWLNNHPRTTYLAKITNPNSELV